MSEKSILENPRCVALLIAAPASGQGKTTVTAAIARHWIACGLRVRICKCGPDFIDPLWLGEASAASVENLDLWIMGADAVRQRVRALAAQADLLLIEGVMGLFDGAPHSAADIARMLGVPVLAVVDAAAMSASFGAIELGLRTYMPDLPWAGVLANRSAHVAHTELLRQSLRPEATWLGALAPVRSGEADNAANLLPHRHLGLFNVQELPDAAARLDAAAAAFAATDMGRWDWAQWQQRWSVSFADGSAPAQVPPLLAGRTIAVARDAAFSFIYPANLACLQQLGAQLRFFSPLAGDDLPACDAVWLPGGYPELHAAALAAQTRLAAQLRAHQVASRPIWAEGGGLMAVCESLTLADGTMLPMWALLPLRVRMLGRLAGLGKRQWQTGVDVGAGVLRGHTFHYSRVENTGDAPIIAQATRASATGHVLHMQNAQNPQNPPQTPSKQNAVLGRGCEPATPPKRPDGEAIYAIARTRASYFHPWFASAPAVVAALFGAENGIL